MKKKIILYSMFLCLMIHSPTESSVFQDSHTITTEQKVLINGNGSYTKIIKTFDTSPQWVKIRIEFDEKHTVKQCFLKTSKTLTDNTDLSLFTINQIKHIEWAFLEYLQAAQRNIDVLPGRTIPLKKSFLMKVASYCTAKVQPDNITYDKITTNISVLCNADNTLTKIIETNDEHGNYLATKLMYEPNNALRITHAHVNIAKDSYAALIEVQTKHILSHYIAFLKEIESLGLFNPGQLTGKFILQPSLIWNQ